MNVQEVAALADWYTGHFGQLNRLYQKLIAPVQHNANQPAKQPIESEMEGLSEYLSGMDFEELSLQQITLLDQIGVSPYIGRTGAEFVEATIKTSDYDPSTALSRLNDALSVLNRANGQFTSYTEALTGLGLGGSDVESDYITIRVGFQNDASINNVTDWKDSAKDWYDIIRGLAMASDEAPEDTRIVGASSGSIILILAGTLSVTTLLALISGRLTAVAKHVLGVANLIEDLRHKKVLNDVIETELKGQQQKAKADALGEILTLVSERLPNLNGDKRTALEGSIKKLLAFNEKGGNVDFVTPPGDEDEEVGDETDGVGNGDVPEVARSAMALAREAIHKYQHIREQLKLLSDQRSAS